MRGFVGWRRGCGGAQRGISENVGRGSFLVFEGFEGLGKALRTFGQVWLSWFKECGTTLSNVQCSRSGKMQIRAWA